MDIMIVSDNDLLDEIDKRIKAGILKISVQNRIDGYYTTEVIFLESHDKKIKLTVI